MTHEEKAPVEATKTAEKAEVKERKAPVRKKKVDAAVTASVHAGPASGPAHAALHAAPAHVISGTHAPKEEKKAEDKKPAKKRQKKSSAITERGKRKECVARATIKKGFGRVRVNKRIVSSYFNNKYLMEIAREPLSYVGDKAKEVDVNVNVYGGGIVGQAQATRNAIANALVSFFPDDNLEDKFLGIDKSLIVEDSRRVEPKKYKGPKARARYQKSYR